MKRTEKTIAELLSFSVINLDKPSGPTSHSVSEYVGKRLGVKKAAHLGTLDPGVSGVLPITISRACRLASALVRNDKTYVGIMRLHEDVSDVTLAREMKVFVGTITQLPPVRSNVRREARKRTIKTFELLERDGKDVLFSTCVEAGTYIRTLVHDLGKKIGGAHMLELRRTQSGIFTEKESVSLYAFDAAVEAYANGDEKPLRAILLPGERVVTEALATIRVTEESVPALLRGKPLHTRDILAREKAGRGEYVGVFAGERLVEIARIVENEDTIAVPDFVLN